MDLNDILAISVIVLVLAFGIYAVIKVIRNKRHIEGEVIGKVFDPSRTVTRTRTIRHKNDNSARHRYRNMPDMSTETRGTPDTWSVIVEPSDGSSKVIRKVPEQRWNEISIGDDWSD